MNNNWIIATYKNEFKAFYTDMKDYIIPANCTYVMTTTVKDVDIKATYDCFYNFDNDTYLLIDGKRGYIITDIPKTRRLYNHNAIIEFVYENVPLFQIWIHEDDFESFEDCFEDDEI